jgi:hypothetical protein
MKYIQFRCLREEVTRLLTKLYLSIDNHEQMPIYSKGRARSHKVY